MEYNFKGSLTLNDYIQCCRVLNRERIIISTILTYIFFAVFIFLNLDFDVLKNVLKENPLNIFYIISSRYVIKYFILITLAFVIIDFIISPIFYKRHYKSDKMITAERNFRITDEIILMSTEYISLQISKEKIKKIVFKKDTIYIFTSLTHILTIKQRYLSDKSKFDELKTFINEKYNIKRQKGEK
jgi:hypothetical protein